MGQRNLVVVVADTLRDPRPLQKDGVALMPFLEQFARQGVTFDRLFASSSWTAPSHVSLLTGADPWATHFHLRGAGRAAPSVESLASRWTKAGGTSAGYSANLIVAPQLGTAPGYTSFNAGFPARIPGYVQITTTLFGYERALYRGLGGPSGAALGAAAGLGASVVRAAGTGLYTTVNAMRAIDSLNRAVSRLLRPRSGGPSPPLHLFLNMVEAHEPYLVGLNGGGTGTPRTAGHLPSFNLARLSPPLAHRNQTDAFFEAYRGAVRATDDALRKFVELLRRHSVLDNAVLVVLSDHGQSLGENGFFGHAYHLYDELVKIPGYLWEFRDGKPVPLTPPEPEWFDHRHLYDLLATATADGPPLDVRGTLTDSLLRRGPAASYFEGPGLRPPDGLFYKVPRPATYRILRVQRGAETSIMRSDPKGGNLAIDRSQTRDATSEELGEITKHILTHEIAAAGSSDAGQTKMDDEVDARLKSWGYD